MNKQKIIWTLAAANVALAATLAWRGIAPNAARAQVGGMPGKTIEQGKYTMIPAISSQGASLIYVLDSANRRVGGFAPNGRAVLESMPTLALDPVFEAAAVGAGGPQVNPDNPRAGTTRTPVPRGR